MDDVLSEKLIVKGLAKLDELIATSDLLMSVAPIRIMVIGGVVAVMYLHNRATTGQIDFVLDPNVDAAEDYRAAFLQAIQATADAVDGLCGGAWLNDHMRTFIRPQRREELFLTSVALNRVLFQGENLVAYVSRLDWALESKLERIQRLPTDDIKRDVDILDAASLVHAIIEANQKAAGDDAGKPLSAQYVQNLNFNGYRIRPIEDAVAAVSKAYKDKFGHDGIIEEA